MTTPNTPLEDDEELEQVLIDLAECSVDSNRYGYTKAYEYAEDAKQAIEALIAQRERAARIAEANFWYENEPRQKAKKYSTNLPTDTDYFYVGRIKALKKEASNENNYSN